MSDEKAKTPSDADADLEATDVLVPRRGLGRQEQRVGAGEPLHRAARWAPRFVAPVRARAASSSSSTAAVRQAS